MVPAEWMEVPAAWDEVVSLASNKPLPDLRYTPGFRRFAVVRVKHLWC